MDGYNYSLYSTAAHYGLVPYFAHNAELPKEGFSSLYAVTQETAEAIVADGSTKGFKGVVWSPALKLDFDSHEAGERAGSRLEEMGLMYDAYDTGNRGYHFYIRRDALPSHLLPYKDKLWVAAHFPEADKSIYTHLHPFRLEGTVHEKTGNRKTLVHQRAGSTLTLPPYEEPKMQAYSPSADEGRRSSIFDNLQLMANTVPVKNGNRQFFLIRQLYALKALGMSSDFALTWITEWNKLLSEPKEQHELEKALASIYR